MPIRHFRIRHALAALVLPGLAIPALTVTAATAAPRIVPWEVPAEPGVKASNWASGLENPWGLAFLPDGRALVTERAGRMRLISRDGRVGAPLSGVPAVFASGQGGLLDVALHPDFARNGLIYFTYATGDTKANGTALGVGRLSGNALVDVKQLLVNPSQKNGNQHFGSRLLFLPDGTLLMTVGDGGNPPLRFGGMLQREQAQNPKTWFGKVLRVTDKGAAVKTNPGATNPKLGWDARLYTIGHRNMQGLARDPATGAIWLTEHGAKGGDELNRLKAGGNFGWPLVTWGIHYDNSVISKDTSRPGLIDPVSVWKPSIAPSGLAVYRGRALPKLDGAILAGGLQSKDVRVVRLNAAGAATSETRIPIDARVRDVRVGPDGLIYVLTDEPEGRIIRINAQ